MFRHGALCIKTHPQSQTCKYAHIHSCIQTYIVHKGSPKVLEDDSFIIEMEFLFKMIYTYINGNRYMQYKYYCLV